MPAPAAPGPEVGDPFRGRPPERLPVVARAAAYAPADAVVVTVTGWDALRDRLGVPSLRGASNPADRARFWQQVSESAAVLTPSRLHRADDRLLVEHGLTADDVDWEARFEGPGGRGFVLGLRPGLPLDRVRGAITAGVAGLADTQLLAGARVVLGGTAVRPGGARQTWRTDPVLLAAVADTARESAPESAYLRRGCVPLPEALGPGAGPSIGERLAATHELDELMPLEAFSVTYGGLVGTVRLGEDRLDIVERADLLADWPPVTEPPLATVMSTDAAVDPAGGRLGLTIEDPAAVAELTLRGVLPYAVCPTDEP